MLGRRHEMLDEMNDLEKRVLVSEGAE